MKKTLCLLVVLLFCASLLTACQKSAEQHTISNYDSESNVSVELPEFSDTSETTEMTGDFSVKEKIYEYEGRNVALLDVTNNTNKDLAVTITCTFLDGDGAVLSEKTQSFGQYSAGYQNYFLFDPGITFEKLTYQLEVDAPTEPMYAKNLIFSVGYLQECKDSDVDEEGNLIFHPAYGAWQGFSNGNDLKLTVTYTALYFGEDGEILYIMHHGDHYEPNPIHPEFGDDYGEWQTVLLYVEKDKLFGKEKLELPEKWKGEITTLACVESVKEYVFIPPPVG